MHIYKHEHGHLGKCYDVCVGSGFKKGTIEKLNPESESELQYVSHHQKFQYQNKFMKELKLKISGLASVNIPVNSWKRGQKVLYGYG
jgi:hypothetical protein